MLLTLNIVPGDRIFPNWRLILNCRCWLWKYFTCNLLRIFGRFWSNIEPENPLIKIMRALEKTNLNAGDTLNTEIYISEKYTILSNQYDQKASDRLIVLHDFLKSFQFLQTPLHWSYLLLRLPTLFNFIGSWWHLPLWIFDCRMYFCEYLTDWCES